MTAPALLEGDLGVRLLPSILAEIRRRELSGTLILESRGKRFLELRVGDGRGATAVGQAEAAVGMAVRMPGGRFRLEAGEPPDAKGMPLVRLILLAARELPDLRRVQAALGGTKVPLCLTAEGEAGGGDLGLTAQEGFLLSRIDGQTGVEAICHLSPASEEETLRALYALSAAGLIRAQAARAATPGKSADPLSKLDGFLKKTDGTATPPAADSPVAASGESKPTAAAPGRKPKKATRGPEHERLEQRLRAAANQDHYEILGLKDDASTDEIRKTYFLLARRFHPDHFHREAVRDLQPQLEKLFARMTEAYQALSSPEVRQDYDRARRGASQGDDKAIQEKAAKEVARDNYKAARHLLGKGQFVKALPYLENAVKADPGNPSYLETLGAVQSLNPRHKVDAETNLRKAIGLNKSSPGSYLFLGLHYTRIGRYDDARRTLKQALSWDSHCEPARIVMPTLDAPGKSTMDAATQMLRALLQGDEAGAGLLG